MKTADTGELLLEAARRCFSERGYHAVSVDDLAREAGLTKGAVYSRFASKLDLACRLIDHWGAEVAAGITDRAHDPYRALKYWLESPDSEASLVLQFWRLAADEEAARSALQAGLLHVEEALADVLAGWRGERQGRLGAERAMELHAGSIAAAALGYGVALDQETLVKALFGPPAPLRRGKASA